MTVPQDASVIAVWFVAGMTRLVFFHKLAEHRIDASHATMLSPINPTARALRFDPANYDPQGRRLLPWYRAVSTAYWIIAGGAVLLSLYQHWLRP